MAELPFQNLCVSEKQNFTKKLANLLHFNHTRTNSSLPLIGVCNNYSKVNIYFEIIISYFIENRSLPPPPPLRFSSTPMTIKVMDVVHFSNRSFSKRMTGTSSVKLIHWFTDTSLHGNTECLIEWRSVTSRYHGSTIPGEQQNLRRRRRQGERQKIICLY